MATWIIGGIVLAAFAFAGYKAFQNNKKGGCGCSCSNCPEAKRCNK